MAAFRTIWTALVSLYEETLVLLAGNLLSIAINLPIGLVLFMVGLALLPSGEGNTAQWLIVAIAWLMPFLPTPGNIALQGLARVAAGPDVPRLVSFRGALGAYWRLALVCTGVSVAVIGALAWYVAAFASSLPVVSLLWLYACLFWLGLHVYLAPLMLHVTEPRLIDLYRRAALIALGHFGYTFLLLIELLVISFAAVVFLPVYALVAPAFVSLCQAHALREIRRRHGDLLIDAEEEASRL